MTEPRDLVNHYHRVVDCQYACPAHTPVPEYIRLIAQGRHTDSYMLNWESNVFPGILGRVCDRPCEPACRRGRLQEEPVAICRLKRVASDFKEDISERLPDIPTQKNGKRIALIGAGPASLTVARDLLPLGYDITIFDDLSQAGGMIRSQIPRFRLPSEVIDEEVGYIIDRGGVTCHLNHRVDSLKQVLAQDFDAVLIGTGAPRGRDLNIPGRNDADEHIHIGVEWLANVAFKHVESIGEKVVVLGGGNTAMDCCRTARRIGGKEVIVTVRSPFATMKASPWEIEDAQHEGIPILDNHVPKRFHTDNGRLTAIEFELVRAEYDSNGKRRLIPTGEDNVVIECTDVLIAVGQENSFPWIERDIGIQFNDWDMPEVDPVTYRTSHERVFVAGDAAFGPENIITAVAQAHQAAISIDLLCRGLSLTEKRPPPDYTLVSQKMGVHEWSYQNSVANDERYKVPLIATDKALADLGTEVELGYDIELALREASRCLSCDVQTVFYEARCIECDACIDVCPTNCLTITHFDREQGSEDELRQRLVGPSKNTEQPLYISADLNTGRVMIKDEDVCVHCGLCAERCPTAAWDMQKLLYKEAQVTACHK
ncbi:MAG: FAD-dependent oxidoreductase [Gammaproteobacteria bacterium]|nr:FAD-dependent oxidoreductase [Gammaproteobacteria bacterium]